MLKIPSELEKGNRDRLLPMSPEFAEFLEETPADKRTGYVFNPMSRRPPRSRLTHVRISILVTEIGKRAGIKVKTSTAGKVKYASCHDLRRSFCLRWASRVMPQVLMELARHEDIQTTLAYYVGRNAQTTAAVLWEAHRAAQSNISGNSALVPVELSAKTAEKNAASAMYSKPR
jgi:integrase